MVRRQSPQWCVAPRDTDVPARDVAENAIAGNGGNPMA